MTEWIIQSRAQACDACGKPFADKEIYHTLLFDEKASFRRMDICGPCWQSQFSEGARERKGFISYWHGVFEAPPAPVEAIRKDTAESLLRKLIELNDPKYGPTAYILAVMLERKRVLKVKEQVQRDGYRVFIYEHPATGDLFTVVDPNLQLDQLDSVQRDVATLLEHGLPDPVAANVQPQAASNEPEPVAAETPSPRSSPGGLIISYRNESNPTHGGRLR